MTPQFLILLTLIPTKNQMATTTFPFSFTMFALSFFLVLRSRTANGDAHVDFEVNSTTRTAVKPPQQLHFRTVQLSTLLPSNTCRPSATKDGLNKEGASLQVLHRYGPCAQAQKQQKKPTAEEILRQDESRVQAIQSRYKKGKAAAGGDVRVTDSTTIPAKDARALGSAGNYFVTVGIGTPARQLSLVFDTGSGLTWTQCQPCAGSCYRQQEKIFDPSSSTSYRNVSCSAASCSDLSSATGIRPECFSSTCVYGIRYADSSFSAGFLGTEKLTLTATDVFNDFLFGCGQDNEGLFAGEAGLMGLGRDKLSLVSQTAQKYNKLFSYCLPSTISGTGFLTFGGGASTNSVKYTPLSTNIPGGASNFYGLDITAISVGGRKLPISPTVFSSAGAVIDSGAVISRLPPAAYSALRTAFRQLMSRYPLGQPRSVFDTCYDFSKYTSVSLPKIAFFFAGDVEVDIADVGVLYGFSPSQVCLAFTGNSGASDVAIFGNTQQKTMEVVYDGAGGRVGFASGGCN